MGGREKIRLHYHPTHHFNVQVSVFYVGKLQIAQW